MQEAFEYLDLDPFRGQTAAAFDVGQGIIRAVQNQHGRIHLA